MEGIFLPQDRNKLMHIRVSRGEDMGEGVCDSGGTARREVIVPEMRFWVTGRDGKLLFCPQMTLTFMQFDPETFSLSSKLFNESLVVSRTCFSCLCRRMKWYKRRDN